MDIDNIYLHIQHTGNITNILHDDNETSSFQSEQTIKWNIYRKTPINFYLRKHLNQVNIQITCTSAVMNCKSVRSLIKTKPADNLYSLISDT